MSDIAPIAGALLAISGLALCACAIALAFRQSVRRATAEALASLARYDTLTGLPNRSALDEHFLQRTARLTDGASLALTIFQLDGLSRSNALQGHGPGDDVLIETARLLVDEIGGDGFVVRLEGARFVVALESTSDHHLIRRLQSLRVKLDALIETSGLIGKASVNVGAALAPSDGEGVDDLVQRALAALDCAKEIAVERLSFFEPAMNERLLERAAMERDLTMAVLREEIEPYFQPIVMLSTGQVQSYEILARWRHRRRGLIGPETFIPLAAECGLLDALTFNLLRRACFEARAWSASVRLSLNVAPSLLCQAGLAFRLLSTLSQAGFAATALEIEVTETGPIENLAQARENVSLLRERGVRVALDDFGASYSSLARLQELSPDIIKIDQCFVTAMLDHDESREIVASIIRLGRALDVVIAAEGIEGADQAAALEALGCELGQGYLFSPAQDARSVALAQEQLGCASGAHVGAA